VDRPGCRHRPMSRHPSGSMAPLSRTGFYATVATQAGFGGVGEPRQRPPGGRPTLGRRTRRSHRRLIDLTSTEAGPRQPARVVHHWRSRLLSTRIYRRSTGVSGARHRLCRCGEQRDQCQPLLACQHVEQSCKRADGGISRRTKNWWPHPHSLVQSLVQSARNFIGNAGVFRGVRAGPGA
jgi:hypothetical protein